MYFVGVTPVLPRIEALRSLTDMVRGVEGDDESRRMLGAMGGGWGGFVRERWNALTVAASEPMDDGGEREGGRGTDDKTSLGYLCWPMVIPFLPRSK